MVTAGQQHPRRLAWAPECDQLETEPTMSQLADEVSRIPLMGRAAVGVAGDRLEADGSRSAQRQVVGDGSSVGTCGAGGEGRQHQEESDQSQPADDTNLTGGQPVAAVLCPDRSAPGGVELADPTIRLSAPTLAIEVDCSGGWRLVGLGLGSHPWRLGSHPWRSTWP